MAAKKTKVDLSVDDKGAVRAALADAGISGKIVDKIIAARPFASWPDVLARVQGVGPATKQALMAVAVPLRTERKPKQKADADDDAAARVPERQSTRARREVLLPPVSNVRFLETKFVEGWANNVPHTWALIEPIGWYYGGKNGTTRIEAEVDDFDAWFEDVCRRDWFGSWNEKGRSRHSWESDDRYLMGCTSSFTILCYARNSQGLWVKVEGYIGRDLICMDVNKNAVASGLQPVVREVFPYGETKGLYPGGSRTFE